MRVLRIESAITGCGPYRISESLCLRNGLKCTEYSPVELFNDRLSTPGKHILPHSDDLLIEHINNSNLSICNNDFHFGFGSIKQFLNWFCYDNSLLKTFVNDSHKYRLAIYETDNECYVGDTQAIFIKEKAKLIGFLEPDVFDHVSCDEISKLYELEIGE